MHCVAHYANSNRTCGTLKELSDNQLNRLLEAKNVREKEQLETNRHYEQCRTIPEKSQFNSSVHGIHLDPCYKLFTKIHQRNENSPIHQMSWKELNDKSDLFLILTFFQRHVSNAKLTEKRKRAKL